MTQDERMLAIHKELGFTYYMEGGRYWYVAPCNGGVAVDGGPSPELAFCTLGRIGLLHRPSQSGS